MENDVSSIQIVDVPKTHLVLKLRLASVDLMELVGGRGKRWTWTIRCCSWKQVSKREQA